MTRPAPIRVVGIGPSNDVVVRCRLAGTQAVIDAAARATPERRLELLRQAADELAKLIQSEADRLTVLALAS